MSRKDYSLSHADPSRLQFATGFFGRFWSEKRFCRPVRRFCIYAWTAKTAQNRFLLSSRYNVSNRFDSFSMSPSSFAWVMFA